jgi:Fur family transcriptional regulator, peroxide stress response regulator
MTLENIRTRLKEKGLKITPQRIAIYDAVFQLSNHPTAENIIDYIRVNHPNISVATVYKVLDSLVENALLKRVKNDKDIMRYDAIVEHHHHLYCSETEMISDFSDSNLDTIISEYFKDAGIANFQIESITLQITGKFKNKKE